MRTIAGALLVPQRALTELQGGFQVTTVDDRNVAHVKIVKTGPQKGSDVVVEQGLAAGERVIVEGFQKVRDGMTVQASPYRGEAPEKAGP